MDVVAYMEDLFLQFPNLFRNVIGRDVNGQTNAQTGSLEDETQETRVLLLENMVGAADLDTELKSRGVHREVKIECQKYGHVTRIMIPRPGYVKGDFGVGKVFVMYDHVESAIRAKSAFERKMFDGVQIKASFYNEYRFNNRNFS